MKQASKHLIKTGIVWLTTGVLTVLFIVAGEPNYVGNTHPSFQTESFFTARPLSYKTLSYASIYQAGSKALTVPAKWAFALLHCSVMIKTKFDNIVHGFFLRSVRLILHQNVIYSDSSDDSISLLL